MPYNIHVFLTITFYKFNAVQSKIIFNFGQQAC